MINPLHIAEGAINSSLGINKSMSELRMDVCKKCPIYSKILGGVCNKKLWLNPETDAVSSEPKLNYVRGCGCKLSFKTAVASEECPAGKW
jgi:hypothetical protein